MQFSLLPLLLSVASAQSTFTFSADPSAATACAGQPVLNACLASTKAIVASCGTTDWGCLCQKWNDVLTCYTASGCPNDVGLSTAQNSRDNYCAQASIYSPSTTSVPSVVAASTSTPSPTANGANPGQTPANGGGSRGPSASAPGASASPTQVGSGASVGRMVGAGSVMAAVAGMVAVFL